MDEVRTHKWKNFEKTRSFLLWSISDGLPAITDAVVGLDRDVPEIGVDDVFHGVELGKGWPGVSFAGEHTMPTD